MRRNDGRKEEYFINQGGFNETEYYKRFQEIDDALHMDIEENREDDLFGDDLEAKAVGKFSKREDKIDKDIQLNSKIKKESAISKKDDVAPSVEFLLDKMLGTGKKTQKPFEKAAIIEETELEDEEKEAEFDVATTQQKMDIANDFLQQEADVDISVDTEDISEILEQEHTQSEEPESAEPEFSIDDFLKEQEEQDFESVPAFEDTSADIEDKEQNTPTQSVADISIDELDIQRMLDADTSFQRPDTVNQDKFTLQEEQYLEFDSDSSAEPADSMPDMPYMEESPKEEPHFESVEEEQIGFDFGESNKTETIEVEPVKESTKTKPQEETTVKRTKKRVKGSRNGFKDQFIYSQSKTDGKSPSKKIRSGHRRKIRRLLRKLFLFIVILAIAGAIAYHRNKITTSPKTLWESAKSAHESHNYGSAIGFYKELITRHPNSENSITAEYLIACCQMNMENYDESEQSFSAFISKYPDNSRTPMALLNLATIKLARKDFSGARFYVNQILEQRTEDDISTGLPELIVARSYFGERNWQKAIDSYLDLKRTHKEVFERSDWMDLVTSYRKIGKDAEANTLIEEMNLVEETEESILNKNGGIEENE